MDNIAITGIGMITALGTELNDIMDKLDKGLKDHIKGEIPFKTPLPSASLRRISRYSKLALCGSLSAQVDANIKIDDANAFRYGTIFTTGYGAIVSNIAFNKSVAVGDPNLCSPMLFAETVPNCCVGRVCMQLNLKGASTILVGGNVLFYAKHLIQNGKADTVFAGAVEEYSSDLFDSLNKNEYSNGIDICEGTVVFILQKEKNVDRAYCLIGNSSCGGLSAYPLIKNVDYERNKAIVERTIKRCIANTKIDIIYTSANNGYFDKIEQDAINQLISEKIINNVEIISDIKDYFGETMGCSFNLNVAVAAMSFRNSATRKNILVTGYDTIGNYHCIILKRREDVYGIT